MDIAYHRTNVWAAADEEKRAAIEDTAKDFAVFNNASRTERLCVKEVIRRAKAAGFQDLEKVTALKKGDKIYYVDRGKLAGLAVIGEDAVEEGINLILSHTDCARLDLRIMPLFERGGFALLKTCGYSMSKAAKLTSAPIAMFGTVTRGDGVTVEISFGAEPNEPVLYISDLSVHFSMPQQAKPMGEAYPASAMNVFAASRPLEGAQGNEAVKAHVLKILHDKYGIKEEDFISSEIEIVPAGDTRSAGLDGSALIGYGFDDRAAVYAALEGILTCTAGKRTAVSLFVDKEEVGFAGHSGSISSGVDLFLLMLAAKCGGKADCLSYQMMLRKSNALSLEAVCGDDPNYPETIEPGITAVPGYGLQLFKHPHSKGKVRQCETDAEYMGAVRKLFNREGIVWQPSALKDGPYGFGTSGIDLANRNMNMIDAAICVLDAHSAYEFMLKSDLHEAMLACRCFYEKMDLL